MVNTDFAEQPTPPSAPTPSEPRDVTPVLPQIVSAGIDLQAGMTVGRYVVERKLARGGMAEIYLAHDPHTERQVAIKVMPYQFNFNDEFRIRFKREAKVIAALEHGSITPVYDFGEQSEQLYIVMRYMAGGSLTQRMRQGSLEPDETLSIAARLAAALDYVHQRGIVHRDLKPDNVLFDQDGHAYLSDFGIVKIAESSSLVTGTGIAAGTPAYMSTEQIEAKIELDGRSDIYAFTVLLYEMLTGQAPYQADTPIGLVAQHLFEPIPQIRAANPDLPPGVQGVIERGMAKNRDERYPTASMLVEDLERALKGQPIAATWEVRSVTRVLPGMAPTAAPPRRVPRWAIPAGVLSVGVLLALFFVQGLLTAQSEETAAPTPTLDVTPTSIGSKPLSNSVPDQEEVRVVTATPQPTGTLRPTATAARNVPVATPIPPTAQPASEGAAGPGGTTDSGSSDSGGSDAGGSADSGSSADSGGSDAGGDDGGDDGLLDTGLTGGDDGLLDTGLTSGLP